MYQTVKNIYKGQALIEILLTIGLAVIILPGLVVGLIASRGGQAQQAQHLQAVSQVQQIQEALRSIQEGSWNAVATDGTYHPVISGSVWTLSPGNQTVNGYTEQVVISDVYRDGTGTIVQTGGTLDPSSKAYTITVSWQTPIPSSIQSTMYLTRYNSNASFVDTTVSDFNKGTLTGTIVTNTSGGEVVLGGGGSADWCKPQDSLINTLTLPKQGNTITALPGAAYVGTGDGTNGVTFVNIGITQPLPPASASASILGTYSSSYKTNAIFSDKNYVYLATDGTSSQVIILSLASTPYTKVGWIDIPTKLPANGIYVSNNIAYVTSGKYIYTYNISNRTGDHATPLASAEVYPCAIFGSWCSNSLAKQVVVVNGYAFVGTANTIFGLQKFYVGNNGSSLSVVGVSNLTWQQAAQGLAVNTTGTRAYVAFNNGNGSFSKGFFIVDTSQADPPSWMWGWLPRYYSIVGSYNTGSMNPNGMVLPTGNRAIITGTGGTYQYQVIDISNETNPILCGSLAISSGVSGVAAVLQPNGDAYSYVISGEAKDQFKIIKGGDGGAFANSGTYESGTFNASTSAAFNNFYATVSQPPNTIIEAQVAVAPTINGTCSASFTYVGPNGDPAAYFTPVGASISATIPFGSYGANYQNPGQCYRYKYLFTSTDINQTATLFDMSTNYSP